MLVREEEEGGKGGGTLGESSLFSVQDDNKGKFKCRCFVQMLPLHTNFTMD